VTISTSPGEPPREPTAEEIADVIGELERHAADNAPAVTSPHTLVDGETKRVQQLRAQVAEAHLLAELQDDETPFTLDSGKVRKLRRRTWEAARLYELAQHPAALAYRDAKVRRVTTTMVMAAAGVALAVSSIGVQASIARALEVKQFSAGWWAAFGVEAVLSLPLLAAVGVQAYSAIRGRVVDRKSAEGKRLFRTELVLLGLTLTLNCWPAFQIPFDLLDLIVHALGPVAAVLAVWVLPTLWKVLADLPVPVFARSSSRGATGRKYRGNAVGESGSESGATDRNDVEIKAARVRALIAAGELPDSPGVDKIRKALGCATATARDVRDRLAEGGGWNFAIDEEYR
jgi:hypothetical protein